MKITFEGNLADIKQEMQEFLAGAATPVVEESKSVEEEMVRVMTGDGPREIPKQLLDSMQEDDEPVAESTSVQSVREYPSKTRKEVHALLSAKISDGEKTREKVRELIAEFGGSNNFKDVPDEKLGEMYARAEAL